MDLRVRFIGSFIAIVGCGDGGGPPNEVDTTGTTGTTAPETESSGPTCTPGTEGCPCEAGGCIDGLVCMADACVLPDVGTSSSGTTDAPSESSSAESTSSGAPESSSSAATDSESSGTESSSSESSESSSTEAMPICLEWDIVCADGVQSICMDGAWQDLTCDEVCAPFGFTSSGCEPVGDDCVCDGFADPVCEYAATAYCTCYEFYTGVACDPDQYYDQFAGCFDGSLPEIECFGDYLVAGQIDCDMAVDACLN